MLRLPLLAGVIFLVTLISHTTGTGQEPGKRLVQQSATKPVTVVDTMYFELWGGRAIPQAKNHIHEKPYRDMIHVDFFLNQKGQTYSVDLVGAELDGYQHVYEAVLPYYNDRYRPPPSLIAEFDIPHRYGLDRFRIVARFDTARIERQVPEPLPSPPREVATVWDSGPYPTYEGGTRKLYEVAYELYPDSLIERGIEGDVIIGYTVTSDYQITDVECLQERPKGYSFGLIGVEVIERMSLMKPEDGKKPAPSQKYQQVIKFRVPPDRR
ncbi:hypothetical protein KQI63_10090 [bacterium]|nr:hypothetical protein [bacterium]